MICHPDASTRNPVATPEAGAAPQPRPGNPCLRRLPPLLRCAWFSLNQAFRRRILHTGITPDQYTVLRTLAECEPARLSQAELARQITSDPNTIASLIERMECSGWIERVPHETDRRARRIQVRRAGRDKLAEARGYALELQEEVMMALPAAERETFLRQLHLVAEACREAAEGASRRPRREA